MALRSAKKLREEISLSWDASKTVQDGREAISKILSKEDRRLLIITGPCSIHDTKAALEYARELQSLREIYKGQLEIVMRLYFEKPRTVIGWKGLIYDPYLTRLGACRIDKGLEMARKLLVQINEMDVPVATEALNPIVFPYIEDLLSWVVIGARTTESQTHREFVSSSKAPVAFKNGTDGSTQNAINSMKAIKKSQSYLGINLSGLPDEIHSPGNPWGHLVLRGGDSPNYHQSKILEIQDDLRLARERDVVIIDCSHDNSGQNYKGQRHVFENCLDQRLSGNNGIVGMMLESNLFEGRQGIPEDGNLDGLRYGVSITDGCIGLKETISLIKWAYSLLSDNSISSERGTAAA